MSLIVPATGIIKPFPWAVDPLRSAAPELWRGMRFAAPLWEGQGSPYDPVNRSRLTLSSTPPEWALSSRGRVMEFAGDSGQTYIDTGIPSLLRPCTMEIWFYWNGGGSRNKIITWFLGGNSNRGDMEIDVANNSLYVVFWANQGGKLTVSPPPAADMWHHLVLARPPPGTDSTLWVDGELAATGLADIEINANSISVGARISSHEGSFDGLLDTPVFWRRELSGAEIRQRFHDPYAPFRPRSTMVAVLEQGGATTLTPDTTTHAQTIGSPALTQTHKLSPAGLSHAQTLGSTALTVPETYDLTPDSVSHAQTLGSPALTASSTHDLTPDGVTHAQTLNSPALTQTHALAPASVSHAQAVDTVDTQVAYFLLPDSVIQAQTIASPALTQAHALTPDDLLHPHTLESALFSSTSPVQLVPDDLFHAQMIEASRLAGVSGGWLTALASRFTNPTSRT